MEAMRALSYGIEGLSKATVSNALSGRKTGRRLRRQTCLARR
jgi:hypothetical protein